MYIGYAFYYFTRKSFTFAIPSMLDYGFTLSELGILGTILSIIYGFSKFISGIFGDRTDPRYFTLHRSDFNRLLQYLFRTVFNVGPPSSFLGSK